jgi:uncharacterized membrane protein YgcG
LEKIELILTDCIQDIHSGRSTLAECLEKYPSRRQELEPLLKLALNIKSPPAFQLDKSYKQEAKAQLLRQIRSTKQKNPQAWKDIFSFGLPPQLTWAKLALAVFVGIIVVSLLGGGTAFAAQSSLPGELLYSIKTGSEDLRLWTAGSDADKANLDLEFARTRLDELNTLSERNSDKIVVAIERYRYNLQAAANEIQNITDSSLLIDILTESSLRLKEQILFSDQMIEGNPASHQISQEANDLAINLQLEFLNSLAKQDSLQAVRQNLVMMENRMEHAQVRAKGKQYQLMQEALLQYQKFNQLDLKILQAAQSIRNQGNEIDNLSAAATQSCLRTLDILYQQVPLEYRDILQSSQDLTLQLQIQAQHRVQDQGEPVRESNQSPSDGDSPTPVEQGPQATLQPRGNSNSQGNEISGPTPAPNSGSNIDNGNGPTGSNMNSGDGKIIEPDPAVSPATGTGNSGNNAGTGSNSGSGTGTGSGKGSSSTGSSSGSTGGSRK